MFQHVSAKKPSSTPTKGAGIARLEVGPVDDPLEREATRIAARVLNAPQPKGHHIAGQASGSPVAEHPHAAPLTSSGRALDPETRAFFEPRFGYDFSKVRIHSNSEASAQSRALGANAYTAGAQIAFDEGRYTPGSHEGRRLLAHELTHVIQQGEASPLPGFSGARAFSRAVGRRIQRDVPQGQQQPNPPLIGPLSITKSADVVSREDVTEALTAFLYKVQKAQGGQTLHVDETVRMAVLRMFQGDPMGYTGAESMLQGITPSNPPEFAAAITKFLPPSVPRARISHLGSMKAKPDEDKSPRSFGAAAGKAIVDSTVAPIVKKLPIPKDWQDKIIDSAKDGVGKGMVAVVDQAMSNAPIDQKYKDAIHSAVDAAIQQRSDKGFDRQQEGAGSPYAPVQPPSSVPGFPSAPGEHIFNLPSIKWDIPTKPVPKPNLPEPPTASESKGVDAIIQSLDDQSLIPAAAKGDKEKSGEFASAKDVARSLANMLEAANAKKQFSVDLNLPMGYRGQPDIMDIFDKVEAIVKQIAAAIPGGVPNVGEVIIQPAKMPSDKTFPARRIVRLQGQ